MKRTAKRIGLIAVILLLVISITSLGVPKTGITIVSAEVTAGSPDSVDTESNTPEEPEEVGTVETAGEQDASAEDAAEAVAECNEETAEEVTEEVIDQAAEEPIEEVTEESIEEETEEPVAEVTEEPVEEVTEEPVEEVTEEPVEEVTEEPVEEVTGEPAEEETEEPVEKVTEELVEEVTEEPAEEVTEEPAEEPVEEEPAPAGGKIDVSSLKVEVFTSMSDVIQKGETIVLTSKLTGFENIAYTMQWQYNDGSGWKDVEGADSDTHSFIADADTVNYKWRLAVALK